MDKKTEEPISKCTVCGKPLYDGDRAYATTEGYMDGGVEGFVPDHKVPYLTVACEDCGFKITEAIDDMQATQNSC
jgi:hypothetical protein